MSRKITTETKPLQNTQGQLVSFNHAVGHPTAVAAVNRLNALKVLARFKQARALDIAAALFPDRGYKAALSATQRTLRRLHTDKHVTRYSSDSRRIFYALTAKGARLLREAAIDGTGDGSAQASASRASEKSNPEHALWSAFAAIACEARGLRAWTETELKPRLLKKVPGEKMRKQTFPCTYKEGKTEKGLMPDTLAVSDNAIEFGAVWFEIDRSARGSARLIDLKKLVQCIGTEINVGEGERRTLRKVVVLCKTVGILRRNRSFLTGSSSAVPRLRLEHDSKSPSLIEREGTPGIFDYHLDGVYGPRVVGQLHLQLLPTHLPSYSYSDGAPQGWFDDGSLPYREPDAAWPEPIGFERWIAPL